MHAARGDGVLAAGALVAAVLLYSAPQRLRAQDADIPAALWFAPTDLANRDLFYGAGGAADQPHAPFTFVREDLAGSNPKFVVRDRDGVKWKIKLGVEARPETVAARLVWAVGYGADEDYFVTDVQVDGMPPNLHRGRDMVGPHGEMRNVRFKREPKKKVGTWKWRDNPFLGTREFNGLRVLMALINNWDVKDSNTAICLMEDGGGRAFNLYEVSDLGGSFGSNRLERDRAVAKGNLAAYGRSAFVLKVTSDYVDFAVPGQPGLTAASPREFLARRGLLWIGRGIPREDARWIGRLLAGLSCSQLEDAFRAAGYTSDQTAAFIAVVTNRIRQLNTL